MARLTDVDELVNKLYSDKRALLAMDMNSSARNLQAIIMVIDDAPTIDIVRCSECKYLSVHNNKYLYATCQRHSIDFKPFEDDTRTHYCAWGERKESE